MSQDKQPEALRLAEMLTSGAAMIPEIDLPEAAAELRRLHAVEAELVALKVAPAEMTSVRMLRQLIGKASFSSNMDKHSALQCLDAIEVAALAANGVK